MAKTSKRIDFNLFDDELKALINAAAKIFPYAYTNVTANLNPNNYEYVRVTDVGDHKNEIYHWSGAQWELIGADDTHVVWNEILYKPTEFSPGPNYYSKVDVNTLLGGKVDKISGMGLSSNDFTTTLKTKLEALSDIAGVDYATMLEALNAHVEDITPHVTQLEHDAISLISGKADKNYVDTVLAGKADSTTLSGHTGNLTMHVTQTNKDVWNAKANITGGTTQPTNGYWFKEI